MLVIPFIETLDQTNVNTSIKIQVNNIKLDPFRDQGTPQLHI